MVCVDVDDEWLVPDGGGNEPFAAAIDKLLSDEILAQQYTEAAHQRVIENFTIPKMMERMNEVYEELS